MVNLGTTCAREGIASVAYLRSSRMVICKVVGFAGVSATTRKAVRTMRSSIHEATEAARLRCKRKATQSVTNDGRVCSRAGPRGPPSEASGCKQRPRRARESRGLHMALLKAPARPPLLRGRLRDPKRPAASSCGRQAGRGGQGFEPEAAARRGARAVSPRPTRHETGLLLLLLPSAALLRGGGPSSRSAATRTAQAS
eukprot:scaffold2175_cov381-Prasinococcus_capsulatus_cf.AAC.1